MTENKQQQTFTIASDERLIEMIGSARNRLIVVAPALSHSVAAALVARVDDEKLSINVVLDADAAVYRLGYGDSEALELLRSAMVDNGLALAMQPGLRGWPKNPSRCRSRKRRGNSRTGRAHYRKPAHQGA